MGWMRWRTRRSADDFAAEVRSHLELEADQLAREGRSSTEVASAARRAVAKLDELIGGSLRSVGLNLVDQKLNRARRGVVSTVGCIDGHAELVRDDDFNNWCQYGPNRLWCSPASKDGGASFFKAANPIPMFY